MSGSSGKAFGQGGFSLIEVLVGLALLSIAVAMLPGSIRLAMHAWSSKGDTERVVMLSLVSDALEQRIGQAIPLVQRRADGGLRVLFSGTETEIEFVGPAETGPQGPGLYRQRVGGLDDGGAIGGIAIATAAHLPRSPASNEDTAPTITIVAGREASLRFRYFGAERRSAKPDWHSAWRRTDALPSLVEFTIELKSGTGVSRKRSVVAPQISLR